MSAEGSPIRVRRFGEGMRIALREGTVDERAVQPWIDWLEHPAPGFEKPARDGVVLDVGAHIGGFTLLAASLVPDGRVLAIEPCRDSFEILLHNVALNELTNVDPSHLALADRIGEARLYHGATGNWANSITKSQGRGAEQVQTMTLEAFMDQKNIRRCAFAKFNCEGAEFQILTSAPARTLRRIERMIVFYHVDFAVDSPGLKQLEGHLREAGFTLPPRVGGDTRGHFVATLARRSAGPS